MTILVIKGVRQKAFEIQSHGKTRKVEQAEAKLNGVVMNAVIDRETREEVDMVEEDVVEIEVIEVEDLINNLVDKLVH